MKTRTLRLGAGAAVACALVAAPAHAASTVNVRIEGNKRELLDRNVALKGAALRRGAARCPGDSAAAALNRATHGRWSGKFYSSFGDFLVTRILGETHGAVPTDPLYWGFWVNHRSASQGICKTTLHRGDRVLMFADNANPAKARKPLELRAPAHATAGRRFRVIVFAYRPNGTRLRVKGALVVGRGVHVRTNGDGVARVLASRAGRLTLRAGGKAGYVRSAAERVLVRVAGG